MKNSRYQGLLVWQKAMDLTAVVYKLVKKLPKEELYSLSDPMRRAVVSIPRNRQNAYFSYQQTEN